MSRSKPRLPSDRSLILGDPVVDDNNLDSQWVERATIIRVNPNTLTCDVETETRGRLVGLAVPGLQQDPSGGGGEVRIPRIGQSVLVMQGLGTPVIIQSLPISSSQSTSRATSFSLGPTSTVSASAAFPSTGTSNYLGRLPAGLHPGDWVRMGNQGQHIALLDEGVAILQASPWAHILATREGDTLDVGGRNLRLHTGLGTVECTDSGGKQALLAQFGTDQKIETGFGTNNWPFTFKVGGSAEGAIDFILKGRDGTDKYRTVTGYDGEYSKVAAGVQTRTYAGAYIFESGARQTTVRGTDIFAITGTQTGVVGGSQEITVSQNQLLNVMNDAGLQVNRDWNISVGRNMTMSIAGTMVPPLPTAAAAKWNITNGSWVVDVGTPGLDVPTTKSSIKFNAVGPTSDIIMSTTLGNFIVNTAVPGATRLGATLGVAPFDAVLWLPLYTYLTTLVTWLIGHTHPTGTGPSGPSVPPPPVVPAGPPPTGFQSMRVKLGG